MGAGDERKKNQNERKRKRKRERERESEEKRCLYFYNVPPKAVLSNV